MPTHGPPADTTFGDLLSLAYASVVTTNAGAALSTAADVAEVLAEQERREWPEPDTNLPDALRTRIAAALVLHGADAEEQAATVIARLPELSDASGERLRDLTRWAGRIYPGRDWFSIPSLDLLTYGLSIPALRDRTLRNSLTSDLDVLTVARIGSFLIGAAGTYPEAGAWITELLEPSDVADSLAELMFGSEGVPAPPQDRTDRLLAALISKITERTTLERLAPVLSDDIGYPFARIALLEALVSAVRTSYSPDKPAAQQAELAGALTDLAKALHNFRRYQEALVAHEGAVTLLRQLAKEQPHDHDHDLARALTNVADMLRHLGRYKDAFAALEEALPLLRAFADEQAARHEDDLAWALRNLGMLLDDVGRYREALAAHEEVVALLRQLADEQPARYQPVLAQALTSLGGVLGNAGRHNQALAADREAVALLRQLADEQPARYQHDLAHALSNFGAVLHNEDEDARQYDELLAAHEEAVALLRQLADEQPARYQPVLAQALTSLGGVLGNAGRHDQALAAEQEAVTLLRKLPDDQPERQRDLGRALIKLGVARLRSIHRYKEDARRYDAALAALAAEQQAVALLRRLAEKNPAGHRPELAVALFNLAGVLHGVGDHDKDARRYNDALAAVHEAITLLRPLANEYPARYQPDLARALSSRADVLRSLGQYEEALAAYKQSRVLWAAVASDQPWRSGDVTELDQMVRKFLRDLGRDEESVKFAL